MKVDSSEQLMQMQLMQQIFNNSSVSKSAGFQVMLESMTKAMMDGNSDSNTDLLGLFSQDLSKLGYKDGEVIKSSGKNTEYNIKNEFNDYTKNGNMTINDAVDKAAKKYNVDKDFILSVIKQESNFQPGVTSHAGAMGLMQLMPDTARAMGVNNAYDVEQNVDGGTKYLKNMLDMFGNSKELALAAYNAGPGAVQKYNGIPKYAETQNYVANIMRNYGK